MTIVVCTSSTASDYSFVLVTIVVCTSSTASDYSFVLVTIVLSVRLRRLLITPLFWWQSYCLYVFDGFWLLLCSGDNRIVCTSSTASDYSFVLVTIVLSVRLRRLLITPLFWWQSYCLYVFDGFWLLLCSGNNRSLYVFDGFWLLLCSGNNRSLYVFDGFWLLLCSGDNRSLYVFDGFWLLLCSGNNRSLYVFDGFWLLLCSGDNRIVCTSSTASDYSFVLVTIVVCTSSTASDYSFVLVTIVLSVRLRRLLITPLFWWQS